MTDLFTEPAQKLPLYVISHLEWEREGYQTFDSQRMALLDMLALLQQQWEANPDTTVNPYLLSGQTIVLDDVAAISSTLVMSLIKQQQAGQLTIGPWYVHQDSLLASGESLIRNLLIARHDARRHGVPLLTAAYMPDSCQHTPQLPQILNQFGMDSLFTCMDNPVMPLPYTWEAPDGSAILVIPYQKAASLSQSLTQQRDGQPDGPFLWFNPTEDTHDSVAFTVEDALHVTVQRATLADYVQALRDTFPDMLRPRFKGELNLQKDARTGRFSARIQHKQQVMALEANLVHRAEPLLAIALAFGTPRFPEIQRALLDYNWRLLLQNQAKNPIAGAVSDEVQAELDIRNRRIADHTHRMIDTALQGLPGVPFSEPAASAKAADEVYIMVWNMHGHAVAQHVALTLKLPDNRYPAVLHSPDNDELPFTWDQAQSRMEFYATAGAVGYTVYTLSLSAQKTAAYNQKRTVAGSAIGSASGESLGLVAGRLEWIHDGINLSDLLTYFDGGDAGDAWHYEEPKPDVVMAGSIVDVAQVAATPTYERLIFRNRMRIAPALKDGKERGRGLRVLDLNTVATYYNDVPGIHFQTTFTNTANDHRVRVHLRTGLDAQYLYTDAAFGIVRRKITKDKKSASLPLQSFVALYGKRRGLALFTQGLLEVEPIHEDGQITLALTLARSVGWLDKAAGIAAEGLQLPVDISAAFMLMPLGKDHDPALLMRHAQTYHAPLHAVQYTTRPELLRRSYFTFDDPRIVMTALKPAANERGIIMRLLNTAPHDVGLHVKAALPISRAARLAMDESEQAVLTMEQSQLNLSFEPNQILTLRFDP